MLFKISWSVNAPNRVDCWNIFGNMTAADDLKDCGENIKIVGRWHKLSGSGGTCIADCTDINALNSWMLNWAPICEISVEPVVCDEDARRALRTKHYFVDNGNLAAQKVASS